MSVKIKENLAALTEALKILSKRRILVGIPQANDARTGSPIGNAAIGYIMENGAPEVNIPARPFLVPGVKAAQSAIEVALLAAGSAALVGDINRVNINLAIAGQKAVTSVQLTIQAGIPPPLKPGTVAARARRNASRTGRKATAADQRAFNASYASGTATMAQSPTTPLYDTGELLKSITYVVE